MIKKHHNHKKDGVNIQNKLDLPNLDLDIIDIKIIDLMMLGNNNKQISSKIKVPLITVQRRARQLIARQLVIPKNEVNYEKFGFKRGLLHLYLLNGDINQIANDVSKLKGIMSLEMHIGNSDILGNVVYKNSKDLLLLITEVKKIKGIERIVWSEQVFYYPIMDMNIENLLMKGW